MGAAKTVMISTLLWTAALWGCTRSPSATTAKKSASPANAAAPAAASAGSPPASSTRTRPQEEGAASTLEPVIVGLRDLQYSPQAREEYGGPDLRDAEVYGVIVEIGFDGTVVIVAGFKDGTSRLIMANGGGVLGNKNDFPPESRQSARQLVKAAGPLLSTIPVETDRPLPRQGNARFAILTRRGSHATERSLSTLESQKADMAPLWGPANQLLRMLLQLMRQRQTP